MQSKKKVLFLCTGNSCRQQMAEGFARALRPDLEAYSAGVVEARPDPLAVKVMAEAGVDISGHVVQDRGRTSDAGLTSSSPCAATPMKIVRISRAMRDASMSASTIRPPWPGMRSRKRKRWDFIDASATR
jgi:hypothetical protein